MHQIQQHYCLTYVDIYKQHVSSWTYNQEAHTYLQVLPKKALKFLKHYLKFKIKHKLRKEVSEIIETLYV